MITLAVRPNNTGSRNKYIRLLKQLYPDMVVTRQCEVTSGTAFIFGDNRTYWKYYQQHNIPYILCANDISSLRHTEKRRKQNEKQMVEGAHKIIVPSEDYQTYLEATYNCPPILVIHLAHSKEDLNFTPKPKIPKSLVYCGGVLPWSSRRGDWGYRSYLRIFEQFIKYGWSVHLYATRLAKAGGVPEYQAIGCKLYPTISQIELYEELSQYTIGFQGYNRYQVPRKTYKYTQLCRPNKLWEYLAAGIPTVGYNGGNGTQLYANKWGIVLNALEEIPTIETRITALNLEKYRKQQVIEKDLQRLQQFLNK